MSNDTCPPEYRAWRDFLKQNGTLGQTIGGIQPMTGPSGKIFTIKPRFANPDELETPAERYDRAMKGI